MSESEWVIEGNGERLYVFTGRDGNWLPNPSPVMLIYALIVPPSFLVTGKQHLSLAIDYFSLPNWWWTHICISSTKAQLQKQEAQKRCMWWVERENRTHFACTIQQIVHKSGLHDRRWPNASLIPTEMTVMYHPLSIWN